MKQVIAGFLLVLWLLFVGGAGAQYNCQEVWDDCFWRPPGELSDLVIIIAMYRGLQGPYSTCDCGPRGDHFPVCLDLDGNCIPLELSDVVYSIGCYRGVVLPIMCPDCS